MRLHLHIHLSIPSELLGLACCLTCPCKSASRTFKKIDWQIVLEWVSDFFFFERERGKVKDVGRLCFWTDPYWNGLVKSGVSQDRLWIFKGTAVISLSTQPHTRLLFLFGTKPADSCCPISHSWPASLPPPAPFSGWTCSHVANEKKPWSSALTSHPS